MDDLSTALDNTLMPGIGVGQDGDDPVVAADAPFPNAPRRGFQARLAESRDREPLRAILKQLQARTVFRAQVFADGTVDRMFDRVLARQPGMVGSVAEHNGAPVGIAWATADESALRWAALRHRARGRGRSHAEPIPPRQGVFDAGRRNPAMGGGAGRESGVFLCDDGGKPCRYGQADESLGSAVCCGELCGAVQAFFEIV